ncbi:TetR/AcrR family transcriptional regulator [Nocardiopsis sp. EMB25]|uniref:TetR/AcrR family transcriptional regulator n=2 Tax=Nocardiopsis TaxID=2013 RepID=UPI002283871A|nr:TetR/AcrR family transcriptional regulator [Nocardiopsis sp. EMB25]MCY9782678.1 TetR/AcrR family transcriptional regulator [Nocardiopsis sp. EMB25]
MTWTMARGERPYHHGDLRTALIDAGLELAREGGADALGLRVVTRAVGVTPNAAYRHFADRETLVLAIAERAQDKLARSMLDHMDTDATDADPVDRAVHNLRGVGLGYIRFALSEPGWFELAILTDDSASGREPVEERVPPPFRLLLQALDDMVTAGALKPERRPNAEWVCWSSVHGFADLATRGPLRGHDRATMDALGHHVVVQVVDSLTA